MSDEEYFEQLCSNSIDGTLTDSEREKLEAHLAARGVGTNKHYPTPIHLQGAYRELGVPKGALPLAEEAPAS